MSDNNEEAIGIEIKVNTLNRNSIPEDNETFRTDFNDEFFSEDNLNKIIYVEVYYRTKDKCPYGRGNVVIDMYCIDGIRCIKLPLEMTRDQVNRYVQPLYDEMNKLKEKGLH